MLWLQLPGTQYCAYEAIQYKNIFMKILCPKILLELAIIDKGSILYSV